MHAHFEIDRILVLMPPWILVDNAYKNGTGCGALADRERDAETLSNARGHFHINLVLPDLPGYEEGADNGTSCSIQRNDWLS